MKNVADIRQIFADEGKIWNVELDSAALVDEPKQKANDGNDDQDDLEWMWYI